MRKGFIISLVLLLSLCLGAGLSYAQPLDRGELLGVFPESPALDQPISRGAFAAMLVKAANIPAVDQQVYLAKDVNPGSWYAKAMATLREEGIMGGYPDGTMRPNQLLTGVEAAALVARTLGLFDTLEQQTGPLKGDHWGNSLYNWLTGRGLISENADPEKPLSVGDAAAFLARVFGSDPQAVDIVEKSRRAQSEIKAVSLTGDMDWAIKPRQGAAEKVPDFKGSGQISMEMILPATYHQVQRWQFKADGLGKQLPDMEMEQYLVDGKLYIKMGNPVSGKAQWMRLPEKDTANIEALMKESLEASKMGIPEELKPYLHYQLLGTAQKDGQKIYEIGYHGRIDDMATFLKVAVPQSMRDQLMGGPEMESALKEFNQLFKSISYWGREEINADTYLPVASQTRVVVSFNDRFKGEVMPVELAEMVMQVKDFSYGENIKIQLPPEALQAKEIPGNNELKGKSTSMLPE
ncbi:S-layer homology domain-containing protein [Desulfofundulus thermocisternus]|uniref:S-layer homology domain-containing protein n=1 Tax=Desulfofundulus thermocisternus TaxID=42471 RepID=UPI00217CCE9F|nr:S-layer homology domain-containing protein [Desulfofundulus thermocisternus]MCS5696885.1 S-layer homology domain-containing protein [Desulfofundulus thermocisternus]